MPTRIKAASACVIATLGLAACGPQVDLASEEQAIRDAAAHWASLDDEKDAAGVAALFTDDGTLLWDDRPPVQGRDAIEQHMATSYLENPTGEGGWGPDRIDVAASGDLAVEQGAWQNPGSEGRYVTVHKKLDGEWRIIADVSIDTPPNGGAPDWAVESLAAWYEAFNARDAEALADLYAGNARTGGGEGRAGIIASFQSDWAESDETCQGGYDSFQIVGGVAAGWGRDFCTDRATGEISAVSRWLTVHDQQPDGTWLMIRDWGEEIQ
ncbi:MAG: SgcJ/EcaC family oxidoreductase [Gemmatimonadetes bacterium]|nr:SgcJ/EcaC family oxidoreductase [Gemmatimonadota bacterium]